MQTNKRALELAIAPAPTAEEQVTRQAITDWCREVKGIVSRLEVSAENAPSVEVSAKLADLESSLIKSGPGLAADVRRLAVLEERALRERAIETEELARRAKEDLSNLTARRAQSLQPQLQPAA